jgi:molybdopterin/thiamine biosynthesis adenylyltransferase
MPLSDAQIARYSRQIIVPEMGGRAQERLLGSRALLIAPYDDVAEPLAYLVGAGVGEIDLCVPGCDSDLKPLCDRMRDLNSDSTVTYGASAQVPDFALIIAGSTAVVEFTAAESSRIGAAVLARLDTPEKIAILPSPPPCIACAGADLLARFGARSTNAGFVAMLAAAEAIKLLAGYKPPASPSLVEFSGYETRTRTLAASASGRCACADRK